MHGKLYKRPAASEKHPTWCGKASFHGDDYELAGWIKTDRNGNKYMSLRISLDRNESWNANLFRNDRQSADNAHDYQGRIRGREDITIQGTNVKEGSTWVCAIEFVGDIPLKQKDRDINADVEVADDVPF